MHIYRLILIHLSLTNWAIWHTVINNILVDRYFHVGYLSWVIYLRLALCTLKPKKHKKNSKKPRFFQPCPLPMPTMLWLTSVNMFVSYPAHRQNDRQIDKQTNKQHWSHNSTLAEIKILYHYDWYVRFLYITYSSIYLQDNITIIISTKWILHIVNGSVVKNPWSRTATRLQKANS